MKISELPEPYRSLARLRSNQPECWGCEFTTGGDRLSKAFGWAYTPEGFEFWDDVDNGKKPKIPVKSLKELEADA